MRRYRFSVVASALVCLVLLQILIGMGSTRATAVPEVNWMNSSDLFKESTRTYPADEVIQNVGLYGATDCDAGRRIVTRPKKGGIFPQQEESYTSCLVNANFGAITDKGDLLLPGTKIAGPMYNFTGTKLDTLPMPRTNTSAHYISAGFQGSHVYLVEDAQSKFKATVQSDGKIRHVLQGALTKGIQDKMGNFLTVRVDTVSFSANGRWLLINSPTSGMLRVDLETGDVLPFATTFGPVNGAPSTPLGTITSDGKYALVQSRLHGHFKIYNLESCSPIPASITGPVTCESRDLLPFMQASFGGYIQSSIMRFRHNDLLEVVVHYSSGGTVKRERILLSPQENSLRSTFEYLGLGDSFASGEGAYDYKTITDTPNNRCHLSTRSYPYLISQAMSLNRYESVACSGAKIIDVVSEYPDDAQAIGLDHPSADNLIYSTFLPGHRGQKIFMEKHRPKTVTISTVGNDIGFSDILTSCVAHAGTCNRHYEDRLRIANEVNEQFDRLVSMYSELKTAGDPRARIYILGYPQVAKQGGNCAANVHLNNDEIKFSEELISYLNSVIKSAADKAGVFYVDVEHSFDGHRMCETSSENVAVNGLTSGSDHFKAIGRESFHPNKKGHELYAKTILKKTADLSAVMPVQNFSAAPPVPEEHSFVKNYPKNNGIMRSAKNSKISNDVAYQGGIISGRVSSDQTVTLSANSQYEVWLSSDPVLLGNAATDAAGSLEFSLSVPPNVPTGLHTLHIYSIDAAGQQIDIYQPIYLAESEQDLDGDGIENEDEVCQFGEPSGIDVDGDGVDDACDGFIDVAQEEEEDVDMEEIVDGDEEPNMPVIVSPPDPKPTENNPETEASDDQAVVPIPAENESSPAPVPPPAQPRRAVAAAPAAPVQEVAAVETPEITTGQVAGAQTPRIITPTVQPEAGQINPLLILLIIFTAVTAAGLTIKKFATETTPK